MPGTERQNAVSSIASHSSAEMMTAVGRPFLVINTCSSNVSTSAMSALKCCRASAKVTDFMYRTIATSSLNLSEHLLMVVFCHGCTALVTMDSSGRIVVPKALRDALAVEPGQPMDAQVRDGRLEIEPRSFPADLVERDGLLVIVAREPISLINRDDVRSVIESVRK